MVFRTARDGFEGSHGQLRTVFRTVSRTSKEPRGRLAEGQKCQTGKRAMGSLRPLDAPLKP